MNLGLTAGAKSHCDVELRTLYLGKQYRRHADNGTILIRKELESLRLIRSVGRVDERAVEEAFWINIRKYTDMVGKYHVSQEQHIQDDGLQSIAAQL
jgi:hypothetical protein